MDARSTFPGASWLLLVSVAMALAQPSAPPTAPAAAPAPAPIQPTLMRPAKTIQGGKHPLAVILASVEREEQIVRTLGPALSERGFYILRFSPPSAKTMRIDVILSAAAAAAKAEPVDPNRILLVAAKDADRNALVLLDGFPGRLMGAVLLSVSPLQESKDALHVWAPRAEAWAVPVWVTAGAAPEGESMLLLMWRRLLADAPAGAKWTIDPRLDAKGEALQPDAGIAAWLDDLLAGKAAPIGPDRQAEAEHRRYARSAQQLLTAMSLQPPAQGGENLSKSEGPLSLAFTAPMGWARDEKREQAYNAQSSPHVQVYVAPSPQKTPLLAKMLAAKMPTAGAEVMLDDFNKRLRQKGYLIVPFQRWSAEDSVFEISSILWPSQDKWHRWLVVSGAAAASRGHDAGVMVHVMDASDSPDVAAMAAAVRRMLATGDARWLEQGRADQAGPTNPEERKLGAP